MRLTIKQILKIGMMSASCLSLLILSGCASIFIPKKQRVHIHTNNPEATVVIDGDTIGTGAVVSKRIEKLGGRQVNIVSPGNIEAHYVFLPHHRPPFFWLMQPLNAPTFMFSYYIDFNIDKNVSYKRHYTFDQYEAVRYRDSSSEKYINLDRIYLLKKEGPSPVLSVSLKHSNNPKRLAWRMVQAEKEGVKVELDRYANHPNTVMTGYFNLAQMEEKTQAAMNQVLDQLGYYQKQDGLFFENSKYCKIECQINSGVHYRIDGKNDSFYERLRLNCTWFFVNQYGERIDSVITETISGEHLFGKVTLMADALTENYLQMTDSEAFNKQIKKERVQEQARELIALPKKGTCIKSKEQAPEACVTVKTTLGHGSGFAISNDGYIVTNFHVISGQNFGEFPEVVVVDHEGQIHAAKIVRIDRDNDLAILKAESKFSHCFSLNDSNNYKPLETMYTIGAPLSTDLATTVSKGIISNSNKITAEGYVMLNMSVSPGNSGGPVFNEQGQLIGVVASRLVHNELEEFCFAVPAEKIKLLLGMK